MIKRILGSIPIGIGLLLLVLVFNFRLVAFDARWYQAEFARIRHAEGLGTSLPELNKFSMHMTRYLQGLEPDPNVRLVLYGEERWLLNSKEIQHMQDVRELIVFSGRVIIALSTLFILLFATALYYKRVVVFWQWLFRGTVAAIVISALGGLIAAADFTEAFTWFHLLVFSNDLWLLNPATDQLINLLPEVFFADAATLAITRSAGIIVMTAAISWIVLKTKLKGYAGS